MMINFDELQFLFLNEQNIYSVVCSFGLVFCAGFILSVTLHFISFGVFCFLSLLNINK